MKTKEEILELWSDYEKCPDFTPVLIELLDERDKLKERLDVALDPMAFIGVSKGL